MGNSVKIGVISDTHIPTRARALPAKIFEIFEDADYIVHAGDYVDLAVIEELEKCAPVIGCRGNMDHHSVKQQLSKVGTLEVEGRIIRVIHDLQGGAKIKQIQKMGPVDIIIHGHSHRKSVEKIGALLILNPGSPTNSFGRPNSVAVLYLTPARVDFEFFELK
jgi:putative phosphoesterase